MIHLSKKNRKANEKILLKDALAEPYIASFCTVSGLEKGVRNRVAEHGLLSQWRWYGRKGGYAIVFDTEQFLELLKDVDEKMKNSMYVFPADVVYSSDLDSKFIEEFEEDLIVIKKFFFNHLSNIEDDKNLREIFYSLMHCACRYKHWGFKEESEVRVVALPYRPLHHEEFDNNMKAEGITVGEISRKFYPRAGALVPYIDLFDGVTSKPGKTLPIKRIIVGPAKNTQEKNRRIDAVRMLINQHGIKADVTPSEIPFVG